MRYSTTINILLCTVALCVYGGDGDRFPDFREIDDVKYYSGIPFIRNFTPEEFGVYVQHWAIEQLPGGEMVFGVAGKLNIYDGHQWRDLRPPGDNVFSLAKGSDGNLYLGGLNELGYVIIDSLNEFRYQSLKPHIPEQYLDFTRVWQTIAADDGIYFRTIEYIIRWNGEEMDIWESDSRFGFLAHVHNKIMVWQDNYGLFELKDSTLKLVPGGDKFAGHFVRALLPYDPERILVGTRTDGFYLFDGTSFERWETNGANYITENTLYHGTMLADGSYAFGTLHGGVVIIDRTGRVRNIFDRQSGLQDQSVLYCYEDRDGILWLALQNGLSFIEPMLPITKFDERNGITDMVLSIKEYRGTMYAGTTSGAYKLDANNISYHGYGVFTRIRGINAGIRSFTVAGNDLLAASDDGLYRIEGDQASLLFPGMIISVLSSRFNNEIVYAAQRDRVIAGRYQRGELSILSESGRIPDPLDIVEDDDRSVYVGTRTDGVYRLVWESEQRPNDDSQMVLLNTTNIGLPAALEADRETRVLHIAGKIRVATDYGLYKIPDDYSVLKPDSLLPGGFAGGGRQVFKIVETNNGELFYSGAGQRRVAKPNEDGTYTTDQGVLRRVRISQFNALYADSFDNIWFGGSDGIYRYAPKDRYDPARHFRARISEVYLHADSLIYRGIFNSENTGNSRLLAYNDNSLRIRYFIPAYKETDENEYQVKLQPADEEWSRWTREPFKDYTNIREGRYQFMVRGRDIYGNISEAAVFEFRVLPPWYRTWWSYGVSALFATIILLSIHKYRVSRILEVERTRSRIARDLHDDIGSSLSSIALMIDMFSGKGTIPTNEKNELLNIGGTARDMVDSLRDIVWVINPEHDKLNTLIERMKSTAGNMLYNINFTIDTDIAGTFESVGMDFNRSVLLIYKEALNNVIKHSRAKNVKITVQENDGIFRLNIEDDGIGFKESSRSSGNGLQNMRYRAGQINGTLIIDSVPGEGTTIELKTELM